MHIIFLFFSNLKLISSTFLNSDLGIQLPITAEPSKAFAFSQGRPLAFN